MESPTTEAVFGLKFRLFELRAGDELRLDAILEYEKFNLLAWFVEIELGSAATGNGSVIRIVTGQRAGRKGVRSMAYGRRECYRRQQRLLAVRANGRVTLQACRWELSKFDNLASGVGTMDYFN